MKVKDETVLMRSSSLNMLAKTHNRDHSLSHVLYFAEAVIVKIDYNRHIDKINFSTTTKLLYL